MGKLQLGKKSGSFVHRGLRYDFLRKQIWTVPLILQFNIYVLEMLAAYIHYKYLILRMYIPQPCVQRAHRNPSTYIHPPSVDMIYHVNDIYIYIQYQLTFIPQMLAEYIQYNFTILKIFIPQPCIQRGGGAIAIWAIPKYWRVNLIGASLMNNP